MVAGEPLAIPRLGITLDLQSHVLPSMEQDTAMGVDDAARAALRKRASTAGQRISHDQHELNLVLSSYINGLERWLSG